MPPVRKKAAVKERVPWYLQSRYPKGYWDPSVHGYWLVRGQLKFRGPDGEYDASGVDSFGPYKDWWVKRTW